MKNLVKCPELTFQDGKESSRLQIVANDVDLSTSDVLWFTSTSNSGIIEMFIEKTT